MKIKYLYILLIIFSTGTVYAQLKNDWMETVSTSEYNNYLDKNNIQYSLDDSVTYNLKEVPVKWSKANNLKYITRSTINCKDGTEFDNFSASLDINDQIIAHNPNRSEIRKIREKSVTWGLQNILCNSKTKAAIINRSK